MAVRLEAVAAHVEQEYAHTFLGVADDIDPQRLEETFSSLIAVCGERMRNDDIDPALARST